MVGPLLMLERTPSEEMGSAVGKLDNMLVNWKPHLPREKQDVVSKNEEVDEILF
jgi:chemotaxis regulatin CheY-phosphate phosphatase CheZ